MKPEASVVIPTYRRTPLLTRCLQSLINQSICCDRYEIIVVTDGPDRDTVEAITRLKQAFHKCPDIRCISLNEKKGPAAARNAGWRSARSRLILFTDDDCIPLFFWVENFIEAWKFHRISEIAFTGKIRVPLPSKPTDYEKNVSRLEQGDFVTANCACTKSALQKIGGLDEDFTMAWREDTAFEFDLLECGIPIFHIDGAIIVHPVRTAPWGISVKEQKKSMFNPLLYKKHRTLYQQKIHNRPPRYYYGIIFLAMFSVVAAIQQNNVMTLASFAGCVALIAWFIFKRLAGTSLTAKHVAEMVVTSFAIPFLSVFWTLYGNIRYKTLFL